MSGDQGGNDSAPADRTYDACYGAGDRLRVFDDPRVNRRAPSVLTESTEL